MKSIKRERMLAGAAWLRRQIKAKALSHKVKKETLEALDRIIAIPQDHPVWQAVEHSTLFETLDVNAIKPGILTQEICDAYEIKDILSRLIIALRKGECQRPRVITNIDSVGEFANAALPIANRPQGQGG